MNSDGCRPHLITAEFENVRGGLLTSGRSPEGEHGTVEGSPNEDQLNLEDTLGEFINLTMITSTVLAGSSSSTK